MQRKFFNLNILIYLVFSPCILFSQNPYSYDLIQGFWSIDEGTESYMIFEGNVNYSVVVLNSSVIVRKRAFGFISSLNEDKLSFNALKKDGDIFMIFIGEYSEEDNVYDRYGDFNEYGYELSEDHFMYYASDPISYSRIDSLPQKIAAVFEKRKKELSAVYFPGIRE